MQWTLAILMVAGVAHAKTDLEKKQAYFDKWDANGDGALTLEEFTGMVQAEFEKKGKEGYEAEAQKRFSRKDADGDGLFTWDEYLQDMIKRGVLPADVLEGQSETAAAPAAAQSEIPANIQKLFAKWDADGDGKMSLEEFTAMTKAQFEKNGKEGYEEQAVKRFEYKDENGDGSLTLEEFNRSRA
jgi:Ca2+-binding EF-hand superfamily protein